MKKLLLIIVILTAVGCSGINKYEKYPLRIESYNGSGWNSGTSTIFADSVQMISTKKAEVFKDGTKMLIIAEHYIRVRENF